MKIITKQGILSKLAGRIKDEYQMADGTWYQSDWSKLTYEALFNLPTDASESDFIKIMGNDAWTQIWCRECQQSVDEVVDFGNESLDLKVCVNCLDEANRKIALRVSKKQRASFLSELV